MLVLLRDRNTARFAVEVFEWLYKALEHEQYCRLFQIILTDRNSKFTDSVAIAYTEFGEVRAEFSTAIRSIPDKRVAVRLHINLFSVSSRRAYPLTICGRGIFCLWWVTLTPIQEKSWTANLYAGCSASYMENPLCLPSAFRRSSPTILTWHPICSRSKTRLPPFGIYLYLEVEVTLARFAKTLRSPLRMPISSLSVRFTYMLKHRSEIFQFPL